MEIMPTSAVDQPSVSPSQPISEVKAIRPKRRKGIMPKHYLISEKKMKFINGILAGKTGLQAALDSGSKNPRAATQYAHTARRDPRVKEAIAVILNRHNCTRDRLAEKLNASLDATDKKGNPLWDTTMNAVKLGFQLHHDLGPTESVNLTNNFLTLENLKQFADALTIARAKSAAITTQATENPTT